MYHGFSPTSVFGRILYLTCGLHKQGIGSSGGSDYAYWSWSTIRSVCFPIPLFCRHITLDIFWSTFYVTVCVVVKVELLVQIIQIKWLLKHLVYLLIWESINSSSL